MDNERKTLKFKTMKERREFIDNYQNWDLFHTVPDLHLSFYKTELSTGAKIIATEYIFNTYDGDAHSNVIYCLILNKDDIFPNSQFYGFYKPSGCGITTVLEYMKNHPECEIIN